MCDVGLAFLHGGFDQVVSDPGTNNNHCTVVASRRRCENMCYYNLGFRRHNFSINGAQVLYVGREGCVTLFSTWAEELRILSHRHLATVWKKCRSGRRLFADKKKTIT